MFWKTVIIAFFAVGVFADDAPLVKENRETVKDYIRIQCKKVNAEDKVDEVESATHTFGDCIKGLFNVEELKTEIEAAKPNGALDEVFKKYCAKTPQLKTCFHTLFDGLSPCLDNNSKNLLGSAKNGTDQLIDFICYKDGDRIALFIAEQGPECFRDKMSPIRHCFSDSYKTESEQAAAEGLSLPDRCAKFDAAAACVVTALEGCSTPTPGNMAESMFRYLRKSSPCNDALPKN